MTDLERRTALLDYLASHRGEWASYLALPQQARDALLAQVQDATERNGAFAGWEMSKALGLPSVPYTVCDLPMVEVASCFQDDAAWRREAAVWLGLSEPQVVELLRPLKVWVFDSASLLTWRDSDLYFYGRLGFMAVTAVSWIIAVRRRPNAPPNSSMVRWTVFWLGLAFTGLFALMAYLAVGRH